MQTKQKPKDYQRLHALFTGWWRELQRLDENGNQIKAGPYGNPLGPNRKAFAELRRIDTVPVAGQSVVDVGYALGVPAFRALIKRAGGADVRSQIEAFAIAAATLARIREDAGGERCGATAGLLGAPRNQESKEPLFAEARFKRLMRTRDDWPDLLAQARRLGAILDKRAPIGDLGASLVLWNVDPSIRTRWAFNYYRGDLEAPDDEPQQAAAPATP